MLAVTTAPLASVLEGSGDIWLSIQGEILIIIGETVSKNIRYFSLSLITLKFLQVIHHKPCCSLQFNFCHWKSYILAASESPSPGLVCPGLHFRLHLYSGHHYSVIT